MIIGLLRTAFRSFALYGIKVNDLKFLRSTQLVSPLPKNMMNFE
jgi:hypothetical protein